MQTFADLLVVRHPTNGALKPLREIAQVPIINGGDGSNEHPTQTLYDLFTINEIFGKIDNLTIGFVGDLKYGRTVHSLTRALLRYNCKLYWIAPDRFQPDVLDSHLSGHVEKFPKLTRSYRNLTYFMLADLNVRDGHLMSKVLICQS